MPYCYQYVIFKCSWNPCWCSTLMLYTANASLLVVFYMPDTLIDMLLDTCIDTYNYIKESPIILSTFLSQRFSCSSCAVLCVKMLHNHKIAMNSENQEDHMKVKPCKLIWSYTVDTFLQGLSSSRSNVAQTIWLGTRSIEGCHDTGFVLIDDVVYTRIPLMVILQIEIPYTM